MLSAVTLLPPMPTIANPRPFEKRRISAPGKGMEPRSIVPETPAGRMPPTAIHDAETPATTKGSGLSGEG